MKESRGIHNDLFAARVALFNLRSTSFVLVNFVLVNFVLKKRYMQQYNNIS